MSDLDDYEILSSWDGYPITVEVPRDPTLPDYSDLTRAEGWVRQGEQRTVAAKARGQKRGIVFRPRRRNFARGQVGKIDH